jgi:hypothetical protein
MSGSERPTSPSTGFPPRRVRSLTRSPGRESRLCDQFHLFTIASRPNYVTASHNPNDSREEIDRTNSLFERVREVLKLYSTPNHNCVAQWPRSKQMRRATRARMELVISRPSSCHPEPEPRAKAAWPARAAQSFSGVWRVSWSCLCLGCVP